MIELSSYESPLPCRPWCGHKHHVEKFRRNATLLFIVVSSRQRLGGHKIRLIACWKISHVALNAVIVVMGISYVNNKEFEN